MSLRISTRQVRVLELAKKAHPRPFCMAQMPRDGVDCFLDHADALRTLTSLKRRGLIRNYAYGTMWAITEKGMAACPSNGPREGLSDSGCVEIYKTKAAEATDRASERMES